MLKKMTKLVFAMMALVCMGGGILTSCSNSSDSVKPGSGGKVDPKIKYQYENEFMELLLTFYDDGTFEFKNDKGYVSKGTYTESGSKITGTLTSGAYKDYNFEVDTSTGNVKMNGNTMPGFEEVTTPSNPNDPGNKDEPEPGDSDIDAPEYLVLKGTVISRFIESKLPDDGAVEIPEGVTGIDPYSQVFYFNKKIKSVTIPSTMTTICFDAFKLCENLTSVKIGDGVKEIGKSAFEDCKSLRSVNIPSSVMTIGSNAFYDCTNLTSVTFEDTVGWHYSIGGINVSDPTKNAANLRSSSWASGIYKDNSKPSVVIPEYLELNGTTVTGLDVDKLPDDGAIEIPEGVTGIAKQAFVWSNITSVKIADGVKEIGEGAFKYCRSLESVNIPSSVTTISYGAFEDCSNLESVKIADGVKEIGEYAFSSCSSLESVNIPSSVTTIGSNAFRGCSNLTDITIPKGVTKISNSVFNGCEQLTEIIIPDGVTEIGEYAFSFCGFTEVTIPASVTKIGKGAFNYCNNLRSVTFENTEDWYDVDGQEIDVKDSAQNAMNLRSYSWARDIYKQTN